MNNKCPTCGQEKPPIYQSQASLTDQLWKLYDIANKNGLYDAADYIKNRLVK